MNNMNNMNNRYTMNNKYNIIYDIESQDYVGFYYNNENNVIDYLKKLISFLSD